MESFPTESPRGQHRGRECQRRRELADPASSKNPAHRGSRSGRQVPCLRYSYFFLAATPVLAEPMPVCGAGKRITCVVDGDTVWVAGVKYRFEEIDTPEKGSLAECMQEGLLAIEATKRVAQILSTHEFIIVPSGNDRYGRTLARAS